MVTGEFKHQLDDKNRFRIPAKLKLGLEANAKITKGINGCLSIFSGKYFDKISENLQNISIFDEIGMRNKRMFYSATSDLDVDNQGRILLPQNLKEFAGVQKNIIFVGVGEYLELWAEERYLEYSKSFNSNFHPPKSNEKEVSK